MNVCVAHLQMNACVAKNFGAWTEKVGHPCPTFMAHPTRVGRRVGALHKKLGHPWGTATVIVSLPHSLLFPWQRFLQDQVTYVQSGALGDTSRHTITKK